MDARSKMNAARMRLKAQRTNTSRDMTRALTVGNKSQQTEQKTDVLTKMTQSLTLVQKARGVSEKKRRIREFVSELGELDDATIKSVLSLIGVQIVRTMLNQSIRGYTKGLYDRLCRILDEISGETKKKTPDALSSPKPTMVKAPETTTEEDQSSMDRLHQEVLCDLDDGRSALAPLTEVGVDDEIPTDLLLDLDERPTLQPVVFLK